MSELMGSGGPGICRCGEYETCAVCIGNERHQALDAARAAEGTRIRADAAARAGEDHPFVLTPAHMKVCFVCYTEGVRREMARLPSPPRPGVVGQYDPADTYEPIKVIEAHNLNFNLGNVIKYVLRAGKKPGVVDVEDLAKAKQYIEFEIARRGRLL